MVHGDGLQFGVVVAEMNNDFGDARLQVLDSVAYRRTSNWPGGSAGRRLHTEFNMTSLSESSEESCLGVFEAIKARNGSLYSWATLT